MDLAKYRQLFLDESREHLQVMNAELLRLEQDGVAAGGVDRLFRAAHSIKGMSGSMGYDAIVAVSHALEDVLDQLRRQALEAGPGLMPWLYEGVDALGELVTEVEERGAPTREYGDLVARLRRVAGGEPVGAAAAPAAGTPPPADEPPVEEPPVEEPPVEEPPVEEPPEAPAPAPEAPPEGMSDEAGPPPAESAPEPLPDAIFEPVAASTPAPAPEGAAEGADVAEDDAEPAVEPGVESVLETIAETAGEAVAERASALAAAATGAPAPELVAAHGGIFTLEPERLAMVRDFVRSGLVPYACQIRVAKDSAALGARNFIILGRLAKIGMVLASAPTIEEVRAGSGRELVEALVLTERAEDQLRELLRAIPEIQELQLRRLQIGVAEPAAGAPSAGGAAPALLGPREATVERVAVAAPGLADRYVPKKASTVRVDTRVLDDLINIVGELLITRERLQEIGRDLESEELSVNLERLRVLVRGFQDTIMTVRMMPLQLVTDRLPRIVRDLAHQSGKQVTFEITGQGIELDRAILEELNDVLIHLVRNAIDHGVESPEARAAAGKPAKAAIRVRAGRERDWVWIRVEDDGRGMDPERIGRAALARGLVSAERVAAMAPREKLMLCCLPGVSTAERVTDISGRGVGMDVVKARVDGFGGTLQLDSQPGRGSAVTLRLPLTLAIIRILLVSVRGQEYGLPVSHVLRTAQLDPAEVEWSQQRPLLRLGRRLVPLHDLGALLGLPARDLRSTPGLFVAVSEFGERAAGLAIDRLLGTYEVVIKPLGPPLKRVRGLAGVTVMGDGRTVLLLDLAALI